MERKRKASQKQSTVVEEEGEPKSLKLVLKVPKQAELKKPRPTSLLEDCVQLETADEVLDQLLQISESHLQMLAETLDESVDIFQRMWKMWQSDVPICSVLVRHLAQLAVAARQLPVCVQEFALSLIEHEAEDVKVLALKCHQEIVQHFETEVDFVQKVQDLALKEINNIHHGVRVECLKLIGQLSHVSGDAAKPLAVLEDYCNDADPRVRTAALDALFLKHKRGSKLPLSIYYKASDALLDSSEEARCVAVRLVWAIAFHYADNTIPLKQDSSVEMKLLDDAFIKICDMVNDSAVGVRALSAGLLGDFHAASSKFLDQTLDKKLMSHLKVVKSEHERQRELHQGGGGGSMDWDSGRQWGSSAPKIELDPGDISLMSAGACGAFVHGLEDEYMEVRAAAVESMCQLSIKCRSFASQSLDFLVDMFNDEIEAVRLKAINCLRQVSATIELREDQLETILGILEESSCEIREALHSLLSSCRIMTRDGLNSTIHALLDNLKKYPNDTQSVWKCLQQLGRNHGYLVSTLVPELLSTHPFFMGKEPDVDDPAYICICILVFNAAVKCPTIPPLFPSHVFRHYTYLRDTLPSLIPWIRVGMPSVRKLTPATQSKGQSGVRAFLCQVLSRAQSASNLQTGRSAQQIWRSCIADLRRVSELDSKLAAMGRCTATFLQCQLLMDKVSEVLSQDILLSTEGPGQTSIPHIVGDIRELLLLSYRLEHTYFNLSPDLGVKVQLIRVAAHAMLLLLAIQLDFDTEQSEHFLRMKQCFAGRLTHIKSFCETHGLSLPPVLSPLLDMDFVTIATESLSQYLQPLVTARYCTSVLVEELSDVCQCRAEILEPKTLSQDNFTKFVSSLALSVHVSAALYSVTQGNKIAVQARFPDGRCLLFSPRSSEVRWVGEGEMKLDTDIIVSHGVWTDPCQVELCVVMRYPTDVPEDSCFPFCTALQKSLNGSKTESVGRVKNIYQGSHMHTASNPIHSTPEDSFDHERSVLAISDVVRVNLHPQLSSSKSFNVFS